VFILFPIAFGVLEKAVDVDVLQWSLPRVCPYSHTSMENILLPPASASGANDAESGAFDWIVSMRYWFVTRRVSGSGLQISGILF
jgi:hypothetical protein